jgi:predicted transposase YdaD
VPTRLFHRHDAYFKRLLDQRGTALALLRERLPAVVARRLVDEEPEVLPTSFISDDLEERRPDRLYLTRTREGQPVLVYTLVEHKSSPDARTGLQLLGYDVQILNWWDKQEGRDGNGRLRRLPALFTIVVYNGEERWNVPLTLAGATEGGDDEEIRPWLPDLRYTLVDLGQMDSGFLSRHRVLRFGFKVLKYGARDGDVREILKMLIREALAEGLDDEIIVLVRFVMMEPNGLKKGVLREMLTEVVPNKAERLMSIAEQCVAEGRAEGIVQGRCEGRVEGRVELILHMMTRRFGPVPDAYRRKIMGGTLEELDAWADALLDAKTLDEVLAAAPSINS